MRRRTRGTRPIRRARNREPRDASRFLFRGNRSGQRHSSTRAPAAMAKFQVKISGGSGKKKAGQGGMRAFPVGTPAVGKMRAFGKSSGEWREGVGAFPDHRRGRGQGQGGVRGPVEARQVPRRQDQRPSRASTVVRRSRGTAVVASCASFAGPRREAISATRSEGGGYAGIHARPNRAVAGAKGAKAVGDILRGLGLGKYVGVFAREEIDAVALIHHGQRSREARHPAGTEKEDPRRQARMRRRERRSARRRRDAHEAIRHVTLARCKMRLTLVRVRFAIVRFTRSSPGSRG